jgi:hypothetical protein
MPSRKLVLTSGCLCALQNGGLQQIADDISRAVRINCGKQAIVMSHSYGANVMAAMFQKPEFTEWRYGTPITVT